MNFAKKKQDFQTTREKKCQMNILFGKQTKGETLTGNLQSKYDLKLNYKCKPRSFLLNK